MFKIMRPALAHEPDLRDKLGKIRASEGRDGRIGPEGLKEYVDVVKEMKERMDRAAKDAEDKSWNELITIEPTTGFKILPHWLSQPYFRPLKSKKPGEPKDTTSPSSRTKRERTTPEPAAVSASKRTKLDDSVTTNGPAN
ncbi:hypothetical protein ONZ45_g17226 [Pleurotus djamor]|nr:hypothetical protein ONZ45_g17226 [Pleurotus djamor]